MIAAEIVLFSHLGLIDTTKLTEILTTRIQVQETSTVVNEAEYQMRTEKGQRELLFN